MLIISIAVLSGLIVRFQRLQKFKFISQGILSRIDNLQLELNRFGNLHKPAISIGLQVFVRVEQAISNQVSRDIEQADEQLWESLGESSLVDE